MLRLLLPAIALATLTASCDTTVSHRLSSPDGSLDVEFLLDENGRPAYTLHRGETLVIDTSRLGIAFQDQPVLGAHLEVVATERTSYDQPWELPWGEQRTVIDRHEGLHIALRETEGDRTLNLWFRLFDDGLAFRYGFDATEALIADELTEFVLTGDPMCWWTPGDWDIYEHLYQTTRFSEIDAIALRRHGSPRADAHPLQRRVTLRSPCEPMTASGWRSTKRP